MAVDNHVRRIASYISMVTVVTLISLILVPCGVTSQQAGTNLIQNMLQYEMLEDDDPGIIADVLTDSGINAHYSSDVLETLTFSFLSADSANQRHFSIAPATGILRSVERVDREEICGNNARVCEIDLHIKTQPHPYVHLLKVTVIIIDVNDNPPSFDDRVVSISVTEATMEGASFVLPSVGDPDYGTYGIQGYQLEPQTDMFRLEGGSVNGDGLVDMHLVLAGRLDREAQAVWALQVLVWDGGRPQRTGSLNIDITVVDSNDNNPKFTNSTYAVTTLENIAIGTTLFTVQATDPDEGSNGAVAYYFAKSTVNSYGSLFGIDRVTGGIYTKAPLDRESRESYTLSVEARDGAGGQNSLSAYARVNLSVLDENDNQPSITVNAISGGSLANIPESSASGTLVARVAVSDPDAGQNGQFTCHMTSHEFDIVHLYDNEYKIITKTTFDREVTSEYFATLQCEDFGTPTQTSTRNVPIYITDINDHAPVFESLEYTAEFPENNQVNSPVITLRATDRDIGPNADLTYTIEPYPATSGTTLPAADSLVLSIHPKSGLVTTNMRFDHEDREHYTFTVVATDSGVPQFTASATLSVRIVDINDEPPLFNTSSPDRKNQFGTYENQVVGKEIGTVMATDRDVFPFANVSYMLDAFTSDVSTFEVGEKTGRIITRKVLDRELRAEYTVTVIAYNPGTPLQSSVNVTVFVVDKNDNAPLIDFPRPENNAVSILGDSLRGDRVTTVLSHDLDIGINAQLRFQIVYRNDDGLFTIDPILGEILLAKDIEGSMLDETYELVILVKDKGDPSLSTTQDLYVFVNGSVSLGALTSRRGSNSTIAIAIISILVFVIILIIMVLCALFMIRRRRDRAGGREQKYRPPPALQSPPPHAALTVSPVPVMDTSVTSLRSDLTDDSSKSALSSVSQSQRTYHGAEQPYHSIYVQKFPAHSSVVNYSQQVQEENQNKTSSYNHLGEVQLQVHDLLHTLSVGGGSARLPHPGPAPAGDQEDGGSVTDSGKGSSEGDVAHRASPLGDIHKYGMVPAVSDPSYSVYPCSPSTYTSMNASPCIEGPLARSYTSVNASPCIEGPLARSYTSVNASPCIEGPLARSYTSVNASPCIEGPLARSSVRLTRDQPYSGTQPSAHSTPVPGGKDYYDSKSPGRAAAVLKGCLQDKTLQPKKKSVHFVAPYSAQNDFHPNSSSELEDNSNPGNMTAPPQRPVKPGHLSRPGVISNGVKSLSPINLNAINKPSILYSVDSNKSASQYNSDGKHTSFKPHTGSPRQPPPYHSNSDSNSDSNSYNNSIHPRNANLRFVPGKTDSNNIPVSPIMVNNNNIRNTMTNSGDNNNRRVDSRNNVSSDASGASPQYLAPQSRDSIASEYSQFSDGGSTTTSGSYCMDDSVMGPDVLV